MVAVMCANAGVERVYEAPGFVAGGFHRPARSVIHAGGKGVNVARVLTTLGHSCRLCGFAGGGNGAFMARDLQRGGISLDLAQIHEESRTTICIVDSAGGRPTRLDESGPLVSPAEIEQLERRWQHALREATLAVISGNPPRGVPKAFYQNLVELARRRSVPVCLDAHEEPLNAGLQGRPQLVKINRAELNWLAKRPLKVPDEAVGFCRELLEGGIELFVVTLGSQGALLVTRERADLVTLPEVTVVNEVGAGDAATAGLCDAYLAGKSVVEQVRAAVACGAASCAEFTPGLMPRREMLELEQKLEVTALA
jgi:1-phosphofructokinase family hexose kinase